MADLEIRNLHVRAADKDILKGLDLTASKGEIHALMGPNGSGKSTLANVIMGQPNLEVTEGQIIFKGQDITEADPDERARMGLFMAFQYPVAIPGVTITKYLRMVMNAHREERGEDEVSLKDFRKLVEQAMELTHVPREFSSRYLNEGFSGGEKKRLEILQLALQRPEIAVLDETDSGLDIDALNTVAHGVNTVAARDRPRRAHHHPLPAHPASGASPTAYRSCTRGGSSSRAAPSSSSSSSARATAGCATRPRRRREPWAPWPTRHWPTSSRRSIAKGSSTSTPARRRRRRAPSSTRWRTTTPITARSVHRGVYPLAAEATELFEGARERIARWLNWGVEETIFTGNVTEALNLVAYAWGDANVGPGDRVVVTEMEHHSNFVPWQQLALRRGAAFSVVGFDDEGRLDLDALDALLAGGDVKVVAVVHVSNTLGTINPIEEIARRAHAAGAIVVVDGAQAVPQLPVDLARAGRGLLRLDRPQGLRAHRRRRPARARRAAGRDAALHHRRAHDRLGLDRGDALGAEPGEVRGRHLEHRRGHRPGRRGRLPAGHRHGARARPRARARRLRARAPARDRRASRSTARPIPPQRGALVSFALEGIHPHDVAEILGRQGICVRAGHHCTQPLMRRLGVGATSRASFGVHNTHEDVDALIAGLAQVQEVFA